MQIRLVSRNRNKWGSRAILNENEIVTAIEERYSDFADVHIINFNASLSAAMLAVNATDVLIGMHGAGASSPDFIATNMSWAFWGVPQLLNLQFPDCLFKPTSTPVSKHHFCSAGIPTCTIILTRPMMKSATRSADKGHALCMTLSDCVRA